MKQWKWLVGILVGMGEWVTPLPVKAAVNIGGVFAPARSFKKIGPLVSVLLFNAVVLAGVIMLFLIAAGGFMMVAGAGQGDAQKAAKGKKAVTAAIAGFVVVFASYWILQILGIITGVNVLTGEGL